MRALRKEGHEDHQIRKSEQPLVGVQTRSFRRARDEAEMTALREIVNVLDANSRQAGNFRIGENFLTRFYGNQGRAPQLRYFLPRTTFDANCIVCAA